MAWMPYSEEHRPVFRFRGYSVYATVFLIILHSVSTVAVSLLQGFHQVDWIDTFVFSNSDVFHHYHLWRLVTYQLIQLPSLYFLLGMLLLFGFGKPLEQYLGRNSFFVFYASLVVFPAILLTFIAPWIATTLRGSFYLHFALMVACATIEPDDEICWFRVTMQLKWLTLILFAIFFFYEISQNNWGAMINLIISSALAYQGARWFVEGVHPVQEMIQKITTKSETPPLKLLEDKNSDESIDTILEKISKAGMKSLNTREREALEKARLELLKKEQKR